jgi:DNA-binding transcriptional LysR family regulator
MTHAPALSLHQVSIFLAVVDAGGFSQAARRLSLSQPAVSQAIANLERQLETSLLERHGRQMHLTEAGQALLPVARELMEASRMVLDTMRRVEGQVSGELPIGCSTTSGKYLLPGLVAAFRRDHPPVWVRIEVLGRSEVLAQLLDGQLPLGITSKQVEERELEYQPFFEDRVILVVPAAHPWAAFGRALPADLLDQPIIMREPGAGSRLVLEAGLAAHGISSEALHVPLQVANAEAIAVAVEEGLGIAFISELAAARGLALGRIRSVEVEGLSLSRSLYMARNHSLPATRAATAFWDFASHCKHSLD